MINYLVRKLCVVVVLSPNNDVRRNTINDKLTNVNLVHLDAIIFKLIFLLEHSGSRCCLNRIFISNLNVLWVDTDNIIPVQLSIFVFSSLTCMIIIRAFQTIRIRL